MNNSSTKQSVLYLDCPALATGLLGKYLYYTPSVFTVRKYVIFHFQSPGWPRLIWIPQRSLWLNNYEIKWGVNLKCSPAQRPLVIGLQRDCTPYIHDDTFRKRKFTRKHHCTYQAKDGLKVLIRIRWNLRHWNCLGKKVRVCSRPEPLKSAPPW